MNMKPEPTTGKRRGFTDWLRSQRNPKPGAGKQDGESPFLVEFFMVQGPGFKCMAYRNGDGIWHEAFAHIKLPGQIRVLE
jgi:hypothetical protein